ncbi:hypothetical protein KBB96_13630 [Luteolibacter ambystomatis]|uniref:Uncharacterized protein n=1 Tax=Luteolibacter ambystomatis TaxID=2824561 RepID=A0A975IZN7_9BACT|nr:hypothetical protein [Luteolibacter ambystomatis]QUE49905.1 hypothetical protein KBB96_13630 [Luteolibacter ambystomatis]
MDIRTFTLPPDIRIRVGRLEITPFYPSLFMGDPGSDVVRDALFQQNKESARKFLGQNMPYRALSLPTDYRKGDHLPSYWHTAELVCTDCVDYGLDGGEFEDLDVDRSLYGVCWLATKMTFELDRTQALRLQKMDWRKEALLYSDLFGIIKRGT